MYNCLQKPYFNEVLLLYIFALNLKLLKQGTVNDFPSAISSR